MTYLRFNTSYRMVLFFRTVIRNAIITGMVLLHEEDFKPSKYYYICYVLFIVLFHLWKLICAGIANFYNNFEDMMRSQCITMVTATGLLICLFYALRRKSFMALINNADLLSRNVSESSFGKKEFFKKLYKDDSRLLCYLNNAMYTCTIACATFYCISVPLSGYMKGTPVTALPAPVSCSFELRVKGFYGIFLFLQLIGLATPALQKLGNEFVMFSLFKIQSAYFKYLSESMEEIDNYIISGSEDESNNKLICWIKMHQDAMWNIHQLQEVFSPIIVLYYLSMVIIVACGLFYQLNAVNANFLQGFTLGIYMFVTVVQFYLLCHLSEELATEAERISAAVYQISWHKLSKKSIWFVGMTINIANKPVRMTAYGAPSFIVNREAFLTVMVNILSAYMGFSKIKEI